MYPTDIDRFNEQKGTRMDNLYTDNWRKKLLLELSDKIHKA